MAEIARYFGFAEEADYGSVAAAAGASYVDPVSAEIDTPADQAVLLEGASGIDRIVKPGPYIPSGGASLGADDLVTPFFWRAVLGGANDQGTTDAVYASTVDAAHAEGETTLTVVSTTNAVANMFVQIGSGNVVEVAEINTVVDVAHLELKKPLKFAHASTEAVASVIAPFNHTFFVKRSGLAKSFTCRVGKDLFEHTFLGTVADGLTLNVGEGIVTMDLELLAQKDQKDTLQTIATLFNDGNYFGSHEVTMDIDSVDLSATIESLALSVANNLDAEAGVTIGSRFPRRVYTGTIEISAEVSLGFFSTDELERFWGGASGPTSTELTFFDVALHLGSDYDISLPRVFYQSHSVPVAGRDRIVETGTMRAVFDAGVSNELIQVTLAANDKARY